MHSKQFLVGSLLVFILAGCGQGNSDKQESFARNGIAENDTAGTIASGNNSKGVAIQKPIKGRLESDEAYRNRLLKYYQDHPEITEKVVSYCEDHEEAWLKDMLRNADKMTDCAIAKGALLTNTMDEVKKEITKRGENPEDYFD
ncbi:hypothetical protein [Acidithiobacillus sp.]|uniref:hypothetical protein n=1 Tax=Acidithiobacillus sp. TaxID=1872118 RepID=UPI003CFE6EE3